MTNSFFELTETADPLRYQLPVEEPVCVGPASMEPFLNGGVGLAAGMAAMERATDRPVIWAAAQYLSFARIGQTLELDVTIAASGGSISHARVIASAEGKEILTVNAALGARDGQPVAQWVNPKPVPPPDECVAVNIFPEQGPRAGLIGQIELRVPKDSLGTERSGFVSDSGHLPMWMRPTHDQPIDAAALALFADFVPAGVVAALGRNGGGSSLDNTLRVNKIVPTEWVLCDMEAHGTAYGMGHGDVLMYAETGELMGIGSQSCLVRYFD